MPKLTRHLSMAEAEDLAVKCRLKENRTFTVASRRSKLLGDTEESAILIREHENEGEEEGKTIMAIAIVTGMKYEFVGSGIFSVSPTGLSQDSLYFEAASLHEMWAVLMVLEETLEIATLDRVTKPDSHEAWMPGYFPEGVVRSTPFVWEEEENIRSIFHYRETRTPPPDASSKIPSSALGSSNKWRKPDLDELKTAISDFFQMSPDPENVTEGDVVKHLKEIFGLSVISKYGYSKSEIQKWTYKYYGQLEKPSKIDENLYLGSEYNAENLLELKALGITHILNVTSEVDRFFPKQFEYHQVPVLDVPSVNLLPYFERALSFMDAGLAKGALLFVVFYLQ